MTKEAKVRCSVCGNGVAISGNSVSQHFQHTDAKIVCYGSFMPVFVNAKGQYQTGTVMFIGRKSELFDNDPYDELPDPYDP